MTSLRTAVPQKRAGLSMRAREEIAGYLCIAPWLVGFVIFIAGAMFYSLGLSLFKSDMLTEARFVGVDNYVNLTKDPLFVQSLKVTTIFTFGTVFPRITFALMIALLLNQKIFVLGPIRTLYYMPSLVSGVAVAILWYWLFSPRQGLVNAFLATLGLRGPMWLFSEQWALPALMIMSLWGVGGSMLIYLAGLQGIPTPLYEAATIDGAGVWARFWSITLPMMTPTIFFNLVMSIIGSYQAFTQALVATNGGPNNSTLMIVLYLYRKGFQQFHMGYASAIAWVLFGIILVFTLLIVRSSAVWVYYEGEVR
jgi:multiple sugar transport system permease protein